MNLEKHEVDHLFDEIYHMNGHGLVDYLNSWKPDEIDLFFDATLHGEEVFISSRMFPISTADIFDRWSNWRREVAYYFDSFISEQEKTDMFTNIEDMKEYFIFIICRILGIIDNIEEYTSIKEPPIMQNNQLIFM